MEIIVDISNSNLTNRQIINSPKASSKSFYRHPSHGRPLLLLLLLLVLLLLALLLAVVQCEEVVAVSPAPAVLELPALPDGRVVGPAGHGGHAGTRVCGQLARVLV